MLSACPREMRSGIGLEKRDEEKCRMKLKNFKVTIVKVEGPCSRSREGTFFTVRNACLEIPEGSGVCLFALGSILQVITAASVPTSPENDILNITHDFQCPDPMAKVIFRIEEEAGPG
jgi:uncharacterized repeat protein (TIGR04076 family)